MLYLTKHEKSVLLFLAAVVFCGLVTDAVLRSWPKAAQVMSDEDTFVHRTNVNTSDFDELIRVPYIGEVTARAIIAYRQEKGKITSLDELRSITVIYPSNYAKMIKYLKL